MQKLIYVLGCGLLLVLGIGMEPAALAASLINIPSISGITANSALLSFTATKPVTVSLTYSAGSQSFPAVSSGSASTSPKIALSNLIPNQAYSFSATAKDASGNVSTQNGTFKTILPKISGAKMSNITQGAATLDFQTDVMTHGMIRYGTDTSYGLSSATTADQNTHSISLQNLKPGTIYDYQIVALQYINASAYSVTQTGQFQTLPIPAVINGLNITPKAESASISFQTNVLTHAWIRYGTSSALGSSTASSSAVSHHTFTLSGLASDQKFYYQIVTAQYLGSQTYEVTQSGTFQTLAATSSATTLLSLAKQRGFFIGSALQTQQVLPKTTPDSSRSVSDLKLITGQYNILTPENELKWDATQPKAPKFNSAGQLVPANDPDTDFNFGPPDTLFQFASDHGFTVHAHVLLYHENEPAWLTGCSNGEDPKTCKTPWSQDQLKQILKYHVQTLVSHFKKKFPTVPAIWDIVNETNYGTSEYAGAGTNPRTSVFEQIVDPNSADAKTSGSIVDYIVLASQYAQAVDPNIRLCINDAFIEDVDGSQARGIYALIPTLIARGVPLYCVGYESHFLLAAYSGTQNTPSKETLIRSMQRFANLGLKVLISELDVAVPLVGPGPLPPANQLPVTNPHYWPAQAQIYADTLQACLQASNCIGLITWKFNPLDSYLSSTQSWGVARYGLPRGYSSDPLPFDQHNTAKPAFTAMMNALQNAISSAQIFPEQNKTISPGGSSDSFSIATDTSQVYDLHLQALAPASSNGNWPSLTLMMDNTTNLGTFSVNSVYLNDYVLQTVLPSGKHSLKLSYTNGSKPVNLALFWLQPSSVFSLYKTGAEMNAASGATYVIPGSNARTVLTQNEAFVQTSFKSPLSQTYEIQVSGFTSAPGALLAVLLDGVQKTVFSVEDLSVKGTTFYPDHRLLLKLTSGSHVLKLVNLSTNTQQITLDHVLIQAEPDSTLELAARGMHPISLPAFTNELITSGNTGFSDSFTLSSAGSYQFKTVAAYHSLSGSGEVKLWVDGTLIGTANIDSDDWESVMVGKAISLSAGNHTLQIQMNAPAALNSCYLNESPLAVQSVQITPL